MKKKFNLNEAEVKIKSLINETKKHLKEWEDDFEPMDDEFETVGSDEGGFNLVKKIGTASTEPAFKPSSDKEVNILFEKLKTQGADLSKYPKWVFESLNDGYIEKDPITKRWSFNSEGLSMFRDSLKLKNYLMSQDETDVMNEEEGWDNTYVKDQLNRITPGTSEYAPAFKIEARGNGNDTKWINLNKESALELVFWLQKSFLNK